MRKYLSALSLLAYAFVSPARAQSVPPNIVVILADDLGYADVGFNGCPDIPTPNIDSIAANGVLCPNGYCTHPYCSPSRAAIMTGRYQHRFGYDSEGPSQGSTNPLQGLPETELTMPQLLKPAGYVCGAIGKWHLGYLPNFFPTARGFDEFFGFLDAGSHYYDAQLLRNETPLIEPDYLTDAFTREGVSFINRHASEPFFLYLAYNAVHIPYDRPPQVYMDRVAYITDPDRQLYAAMAVALDDGVGQVLQTLRDHNVLDNTLIFFLSDNGAPRVAADNGQSNNYPLAGYKLNVLEGGIRVPFAVQWSGRLPAHAVYDGIVSSLDILATATAAAGISLPMDRVYDGLNIVPYLAKEQVSPKRTLFWRWFGLGPDAPPGNSRNTIWAVRSGGLKLVTERAEDDQPPALYDLDSDIGETQDLAANQPAEVSYLTQLYARWTLDTIPPIWQKYFDLTLLPVVLAGDWNGFKIDDPNLPWNLALTTAPDLQGTPDAFNWFKNTIHVAATGGDTTPGEHSFALIGGGSYRKQWGGVPIDIDTATDIPSTNGSVLGPTNKIFFQAGYYSFRIIDRLDQVGVVMRLAVMKTSAPPISIIRSGQIPAVPTPDDPITVDIAASEAKSPEERVYLRWSTDLFITSHLVEAEGSGVSYSATIPPQPAGTSVLYTIITATNDLAGYSTSGAIDALILATTGVFNAVPPVPASITTQPVDKTVTVGQRAKFGVRATGTKPLGYQWKKNGSNIVGATKSYYTTPPTTLADNGALFAVIVSDRAGSLASNNATLTVQGAPKRTATRPPAP